MASRSSRDRGAILIWATLAIVMVVTFAAVALNVGHLVAVKGELRNAADSAALAGALQLRGTPAELGPADSSADALASAHPTDRFAVETSRVVLGQWIPPTRTCDARDSQMPLPSGYSGYAGYRFCQVTGTDAAAAFRINAVYARAERSQAAPGGGAVPMAFGRLLGRESADVGASAIAVTGGPCASGCLNVPMVVGVGCLTDSGGGLVCDPNQGADQGGPLYALGLSSTQVRSAGWSTFTQRNPNENAICDYLQNSQGTCTKIDVGTEVELIDIGQGNKFNGGCKGGDDNKKTCDWFADYVGQQIEVPIISMSGSVGEACPSIYNGSAWIVGFATFRVLAVDCKTGNGCVPGTSPWCATCDQYASGTCVVTQLVCNHKNGEDRSTGCAWTGTSPLRPILVR